MKPVVAIIGRPNVGKSALFNRIVGKRLAVVEDIPGLTRDRIYGEAHWEGKSFLVVDTGGFESRSGEDIVREVKKQAIAAVEEADIVLLLMDAKTGLMPSDVELCNILRTYDKKIFYAVNKVDGRKDEQALYEFYSLGEEALPVSALNGYGFEGLMDHLAAVIRPGTNGDEEVYPKIAIVGRPNVGKSTLVNSLLSKQRMIVSPEPGTTRDSVDTLCTYYRKKYLLIDTAGIRKKGKIAGSFERYSFIRTLRNIENCDIALLLLDATDGVVEVDQKIAGLIHEAGKGSMLLFNKWDLVEKSEELQRTLDIQCRQKLWFLTYSPMITISALSRRRITKIFPMIDEIIAGASRRVSARDLNNVLRDSLAVRQPPLHRGRRVKISYIAQIGIKPPRFVIFTNRREGIKQDYIKFIERQLREKFIFRGVPIRIHVRQKK